MGDELRKALDTFDNHSDNSLPPVDSLIIAKQIGEGDQQDDGKKASDTFDNHLDNAFHLFCPARIAVLPTVRHLYVQLMQWI